MVDKTFLLGVGCQKGGTTWLHNHLRRHPQTALGIRKEYHVLDSVYIPECAHFRTKNINKAKALYDNNTRWLSRKDREKILHATFYADLESYFDYFTKLAAPAHIRLTGDLTPSYAGLPVEALESAKNALNERGFTVKVVFLMRDPIKRCVSAMRMDRRKFNRTETNENEDLLRIYSSRDFEIRTQYEKTIGNIEAVFSQKDIFYGFYEQLFSEPFIKKITSFLALEYLPPKLNKKINVDKSAFKIDENVLQQVFNHYQHTYEVVAKKFGAQLIYDLWPNYAKYSRNGE